MGSVDPQIQAILDRYAGASVPQSVEEARAGYDRTSLLWVGEAEEVASVADERVGHACVRVYRPAVSEVRGAVLWVHGGGWIMGNLTSHDALCRALANRVGAAVVAVDYRLAPETRFPGAVEDCEAALRWVASEAFPGEPLAVAGDSAGGNLATVLARRARDAGAPSLRAQLLVYPATDAACATGSHLDFGRDGTYGLSRDEMAFCWAAYAPGSALRSADVSPLRAADLSRMPPTYLLLAELDALTDEATDYADRLEAAGTDVTVKVWPGTVHGFLRWRACVDAAHTALDEAASWLRTQLAA